MYPLSGYFADVWCGRYKASLVLLCVALATSILLCGATIIGMTKSWRVQHFGLGCSIPFGVLLILMFITIILSFSCYQANIIQLGLDQLLEASGEKLSHFIHWLMWHTRWEASYHLSYSCFCHVPLTSCISRQNGLDHKFNAISYSFSLVSSIGLHILQQNLHGSTLSLDRMILTRLCTA